MSDSNILVEYAYRPKKLPTILISCLAISGAFIMTWLAINLDRPIYFGKKEFTAEQVRILFFVISLMTPIGVVPLLGMVVLSFSENRRVALTDESILIPRHTWMGNSCEAIEVRFDRIQSAPVANFIGKEKVMRIQHSEGIVLLMSHVFLNKKEFPDFCNQFQSAFASFQKRLKTNSKH